MNTVAVSVVLYQVGLRFPNPTPSSVPAVLTPSMESLRRSLKPHHGGSHKYTCPRNELEEQSILLHNDGAEDGGEVVVKVDAKNGGLFDQPAPLPDLNRTNNSKVWREPSYEFWKEDDGDGRRGGGGGFSFKKQQRKNSEAEIADDPPSRLISTFLHKQRASGAELALDMDVEMEELKKHCSAESHLHRSSDDDGDGDERGLRRRKPSPSTSGGPDGGGGEVVQCTSNGSVHRNSTLLRAKTRSRLMDPAPPPPSGSPAAARNDEVKKSGRIPKSGQIRSGQLKSQLLDEDDEDPFMDDDIPDQFKRPDFRWLTVLQWLSLFLILAAIACSLALSPLERLTLLDLHLWKWFVLLFVLICGRLVSGWVVRLVVFGVERNFLLRKRVLYFVYGIRKAVQNCLWLGLVLISWHLLFDEKVRRETRSNFLPYVTKILFCLLVATLLRLVKTLLVKVLASSFHVSTYFDRIQESLFNQYVIETLSGPPLVEIQNVMEEEERVMAEVQKLQNAGARITNELRAAALPSKSGRVIGSGPMPKSSQIGKNAKISGAKQQDEGITIDELHKLNPKNISAWRMKKLMRIVRNGTLTTLDEQVLQECGEDDSVMQIRSEYEAKAAARNIFGNVAKPGAKYFYLVDLMRFMKEDEARKTMSMFEGANENNRVCRKSLKNWVVNAFRDRRALSLTLNDTKTALLLAAFVFGNTLKMIFEAIIFLFLMHPFDVGDRCEVEGVQMVVEEMNILTTVFLRYDNQKITFMANKKEHWYPNPSVVLRDVDDMNRLRISIWMRHRINFQDMGEKWARRELVVQEMIKVLREFDIEYRMLPIDVNLRTMAVVDSTRLPSTWTTFNC
ncbi:Late embryogenesis abundant protein [Musa troglodytarum]|uniref:Mechanosensitive ion channel protein n=1 Tax=Musa troglodytarum TaxID=320322 RepID=A0A9E7I4Q4_9LILI|nr:Late embryogenesis abundant protein [Musa troglodytarum]